MKNKYFKIVTVFCATVFCTVFLISSYVFAQFEITEAVKSPGKDTTISLDLKGMDVVEVLKTLATKGDMNVVVGANVRGRVTMFLKDVDIKDAFEIILAANNLASDKRGNIIYVMTDRDYEQLYGESYTDKREVKIIPLKYAKAPELEKILNQIKTKIGKVIMDEGSNTLIIIDSPGTVSQAVHLIEQMDNPTKTVVFELSYATVVELKDKIQEMLTKGIGRVQIDERTNKIIVTDLENNIPRIEKMVWAFDDRLRQVLIEAKIVEITLSDRFQLGVNWESVIKELQKQVSIKSTFQLAASGGLIPGAEFLIGTLGSDEAYATMVQILKTVGDTNILSSPRITVVNNKEAKILVGSSEPYATNTVTQGTSTTTTATALTFLDVGVKLFVTPTINKDGFVTIKIRPEVSSKVGDYTYGSPSTTVPIVSTTQAETSVTIKDGTTIIIAGLIKDERTKTVTKVPILGDIPVVGLILRKTDTKIAKKELVIFLTPHIISGSTDYLEQPLSPPIGERRFTMPEGVTFERRPPSKMEPGYFSEKPLQESKKLSPYSEISDPETYFYAVKNKVLQYLAVPQDEEGLYISEGDSVTVSFSLNPQGSLIAEPEIIDTTNEYFGKAAIMAVKNAAPFPPFPISFKESKKSFTLDILYEPNTKREKEKL